jgi:UDP-glucuronate decarboxylase
VDDPKQRQPDISLAGKELKWRPEVKLETGLKRTIKYFKKELKLK